MAKAPVVISHKPAAMLGSMQAIDTKIKSVATRGKTLQADMHLLCCSILEHLMQHEDTRVVERFTAALPAAARINAVKQWFELYAPITYHKGKPGFNRAKKNSAECIARDGFEKPFWLLKGNEGVAYQPMNVIQTLSSLVAKLDKDSKEAGVDHSELKAVLENYIADQKAKADLAATRPMLQITKLEEAA